jgi:sec-independent protein translocase protein TatA
MELGVILFIAVMIFGPRQLPKMGKAIGETIREMRGIGKELHGDSDDESSRRDRDQN